MSLLTCFCSLLACGIYYYLWIHAIPQWRGYRIRHETVVLDGGEVTHRLTKVNVDQLAEWDAAHNAAGDKLDRESVSDDSSDVIESTATPKETA